MQAQGVNVDQEEWQKEYDAEAARLEEAAKATTSRGPDGKFTKAEPDPVKEPEQKQEPVIEPEPTKEPDPLAEIRAKLEKTEKALQDTKAWGTKTSQELAALRREAQERQRAAERPAILDEQPELEKAIKYVIPAPGPDPEKANRDAWQAAVETVHPGIFNTDIDPELEKAILTRFDALNGAQTDPLIAIREITAEKLAFSERQLGKRFAAESAKAAQKSAMSVPGAGSGGAHKAPLDNDSEAVNRILNMSSADFEKERLKALKLI